MTNQVLSETLGRPALGAGRLAASTPYSWPWDGQFSSGRCALLLVSTDEPSAPDDNPAWAVVRALSSALSSAGGLIVPIETHRPMRLTNPSINLTAIGSAPISSPGWDGFYGTPLDNVLRAAGRDLLILVGSWLETGVHSTMRSANDRGYECVLVADACVSADSTTTAGALSSIEMSGGIFGAVTDSTELLSLIAADLTPANQEIQP
jgi:hypothetical protein